MLADIVKGYTTAASESATAAGRRDQVARELGEFSWQVTQSGDLRAALADPQLAVTARLGIVADLVEGKVAPETAADLRFLLRVSAASEVSAAFADLATFARHQLVAPTTGRVREIMRGYSERVFEELTDHADLDRVEDDLFALARAFESTPTLREAFSDDNSSARLGLARDLFSSRVAPATLRIVNALLEAGHTRNLAGTFDWLASLVAAERGRRIAEVRSAVPLDDDERDRLAASLTRLTGRTVEVRVIPDPAVVGGVLVAVGDFMIDATVRLRLERLRDALGASA